MLTYFSLQWICASAMCHVVASRPFFTPYGVPLTPLMTQLLYRVYQGHGGRHCTSLDKKSPEFTDSVNPFLKPIIHFCLDISCTLFGKKNSADWCLFRSCLRCISKLSSKFRLEYIMPFPLRLRSSANAWVVNDQNAPYMVCH